MNCSTLMIQQIPVDRVFFNTLRTHEQFDKQIVN